MTNKNDADYSTPQGYNENDYQKMIVFSTQLDDKGNPNIDKLGWNMSTPDCWEGVTWSGEPDDKRIIYLTLPDYKLCGALDISECTMLEEVDCYKNNLTEVNAGGCTALCKLECGDNQIAVLNIAGCSGLRSLNCYMNKLTVIDISSCEKLTAFECYINLLEKLVLPGSIELDRFDCHSNLFSSLDLSKCTALVQLECYGNQLMKLDLFPCNKLEYLDCKTNQIKNIVFPKNLNELNFVDISGNKLDLNDAYLKDIIETLEKHDVDIHYDNQSA